MEKSRIAVGIIAFAATTWLLDRMSAVLIPFVFAVFLYYNVLAVMKLASKFRPSLTHWQQVTVALGFYVLVYFVLGLMVASSLKTALQDAPLYQEKVLVFNERLAAELTNYGVEVSQDSLKQKIADSPVFAWISSLSGGLAGLLGNASLTLIIMLFLLASPPVSGRPVLDKIQDQLIRYIIIKTLVSLATGLCVGVVLAMIGVDLAALFGLLTFLLNFVPNIGSVLASLLPIPVAALQFGFGTELVLAVLIPMGLHFVIGNILEPRFLGDSLDLHPLTVLFALMYWGLVWGITGMFLSVPLVVVLKIVFERFESTRRAAEIMAGRF